MAATPSGSATNAASSAAVKASLEHRPLPPTPAVLTSAPSTNSMATSAATGSAASTAAGAKIPPPVTAKPSVAPPAVSPKPILTTTSSTISMSSTVSSAPSPSPSNPPPSGGISTATTTIAGKSLFICQICKSPMELDPTLIPPTGIRDKKFQQHLAESLVMIQPNSVGGPSGGATNSGGTGSAGPSGASGSTSGSGSTQEVPSEKEIAILQQKYTNQLIQTMTAGTTGSATTPAVATGSTTPFSTLPYSEQFAIAQKLFELSTAATHRDQPVCTDCTDLMLDMLDRQIQEAERERASYQDFLTKLDSQQEKTLPAIPSAASADAAGIPTDKDVEQELRKMQEKERTLQEKLQRLESERLQTKKELDLLKEESRELERMEERYWQNVNEVSAREDELDRERALLASSLSQAQEQLERLKRTNVLNDVFHIEYAGHFGTINGLRMGRLPSQPVSWDENNAAWGHVTLLLATLARGGTNNLHSAAAAADQPTFQFTKYRLQPLGSFSKISSITPGSGGSSTAASANATSGNASAAAGGAANSGASDSGSSGSGTSYELYGSNDSIALGRFFWKPRFDTAMSWFLECVAELVDHFKSLSPQLQVPYAISPGEGKIGGLSIKQQGNSDENWTKALKYLLTVLKFLLSDHVRRQALAKQQLLQQAAAAAASTAASEAPDAAPRKSLQPSVSPSASSSSS